jgi:hypothetical protein
MNVTLQGRIDASYSPYLLLIVKLCLLVQRLSYFTVLSVANFCGVVCVCVCVSLLMHLRHKTYTAKMNNTSLILSISKLASTEWSAAVTVARMVEKVVRIKSQKNSSLGQQRHTLGDIIKMVNQNVSCAEVFTLQRCIRIVDVSSISTPSHALICLTSRQSPWWRLDERLGARFDQKQIVCLWSGLNCFRCGQAVDDEPWSCITAKRQLNNNLVSRRDPVS